MDPRVSISKFERRSRLYSLMNILLIIWCIAQISIYAYQLSFVPCQEGTPSSNIVRTLGICYIVNYILYMLVPILALLTSHHCCNLAAPIMVYCGINIVIKIVSIAVVMTVGWRHVGMCYINKELKILIICSSAAEIFVLACQILILFKRRTINLMRESLVKKQDIPIQPVLGQDTSGREIQWPPQNAINK